MRQSAAIFQKCVLLLPVLAFWLGFSSTVLRGDLPIPKNPRWKVVSDDVYLQETGFKVETEHPLLSVAVINNKLYTCTKTELFQLNDRKLVKVASPTAEIRGIDTVGGQLWLLGETGLWRFDKQGWTKISDEAVVDLCEHLEQIVAATAEHLYQGGPDGLTQLDTEEQNKPPILGVDSYAETLYVRNADRIGLLELGRINYRDVDDWGQLPLGSKTRDMQSLGSKLTVATDRGLGVLHGLSWRNLNGRDGLCYEDTTCVADGFAQDYWVGTMKGAIRVVDGEFQFFGHERWIPHDKVNDIVCGNNVVYIATDGGLGVIEYEPYTLFKKAAWYEKWMDQWEQKRLGFVHNLVWDEDEQKYVRFLSDNDGGWVSHYLDALCFKYAVTKDPAVREAAVDVFRSLKWCEEISGIDGFPARSIYAVGENGVKAKTGSGGLPAEWNKTEDGKFEWKGDTSSDEVDAHIFATTLFIELVAQGKEKEAAQEHLHRIVSHIIRNGWTLHDKDGKPTRWARWDPEYLQRPYGFQARGLNGMEAFNYVVSTYALTGDPKFKEAKQQLIDWEYHHQSLRQKLVFPFVTHFDDRLAFYSYYPLLRYETDPYLRSIFRRSLERSWEVKRNEHETWFNYVYAALTGNECDNEISVKYLREWPLDCIAYPYTNSHRHDLQNETPERNYVADYNPRHPREQGPKRWDSNVLSLDSGGHGVHEPTGWLDAYWMGRYYGLITPPTTDDPKLLEPGDTLQGRKGAEPYNGPPRPEIFGF